MVHVTPRILYITCGHVIEDRLSTFLRWTIGYKLWFNEPARTTLEPCQMSHEIIRVTTSKQVGVVTIEGKTSYIPLLTRYKINNSWVKTCSKTCCEMLHEIGIIVLSEQMDLNTTPSNKFHQRIHKVKYCKGGLVRRHGHVTWN
jgi:hypothetical protein